MNFEIIVLVAIAGIGVGGTLYFILAKKTKHLKWFLSVIGGSAVSMLLIIAKSITQFEVEAKQTIKDSKEEDSKREDTVGKIDDRIKKNKELLSEIDKIIGD